MFRYNQNQMGNIEEPQVKATLSMQQNYLLVKFEQGYEIYKALMIASAQEMWGDNQYIFLESSRLLLEMDQDEAPLINSLQKYNIVSAHHDQLIKKIIQDYESADQGSKRLVFCKDKYLFLLTKSGHLLRFDWKVVIGKLPNESEQAKGESFSFKKRKYVGLYYELSKIKPQYSYQDVHLQAITIICLENKKLEETEKKLQLNTAIQGYRLKQFLRQLNGIGIFQIFEKGKMTYGFGIFIRPFFIVTLTKYLNQGKKLGRVFLKKEQFDYFIDQKQPFRFDLASEQLFDIFEADGNLIPLGEDKRFTAVEFKDLDQDQSCRYNIPYLIKHRQLRCFNTHKGMSLRINFDDNFPQVIQFCVNFFEVDSIINLRSPFTEGLILVAPSEDINYKHLYGFYDDSKENEDKIAFFPKDYLVILDIPDWSDKTAPIPNNRARIIIDNEQFPYNSIGKLNYVHSQDKVAHGTASVLYDSAKEECTFLITCAHNFLYLHKQEDDYGQTIYELVDQSVDEQLNCYNLQLKKKELLSKPSFYQLKQVKNFHIKKVHIPDQYKDNLIKEMNNEQEINEKEIKSKEDSQDHTKQQKQRESISVQGYKPFDIAVIELQKPIKVEGGFRIEMIERMLSNNSFQNIQVTGFPRQSNYFKINIGFMQSQSTDGRKDYFSICQDGKGQSILKHKLTTLQGNSGSPVYQKITQKQCYLLGIHTTGYYQEGILQKQNVNAK